MGIRQHQRVAAELVHLAFDARQLVGLRFPRELQAVQRDLRERRGRALGPDRIDRILLDRDQFGAGLGAGGRQALGRSGRMQPGIVAEPVARLQVLRQPAFRRRVDQRFDRPGLAIDLLCGLQGVATIDEHGRRVGEHDREASRAGEAGEPGQPLGGRRNVFPQVLVGARDDEAGEPAPGKFRS
jgi:hypothetical protein